jgi:hypothetical protein
MKRSFSSEMEAWTFSITLSIIYACETLSSTITRRAMSVVREAIDSLNLY